MTYFIATTYSQRYGSTLNHPLPLSESIDVFARDFFGATYQVRRITCLDRVLSEPRFRAVAEALLARWGE